MAVAWANEYFKKQPAIVAGDLELRSFAISVRSAPWPFPDDLKVQYSNIFYQTIFSIIAEAGIPKSSLSFTSPEKALEINKSEGDRTTGWFGMTYKEPGKEFGLTVDDEIFQIRCDGILLKDLVNLASSIFSRITDALISENLAKPVLLLDRVHTVDYAFNTVFRLGTDKIQQRQVKNYELLSEALSLGRVPNGDAQRAVADALPTIGTEQFIRMDYTQHAIKTIDGQKFNVGLLVQCPFNEANSLLDVTTFLRGEEEFGFDLQASLKWETALVSFFREIILKRFLDNLLCSTTFTRK